MNILPEESVLLKVLRFSIGIALAFASVAHAGSNDMPASRPSALTTDGENSDCDSVKTNRSFESIASDLDLFDSTIDLFFLEGVCVVNILDLKKAPSFHVILQAPGARIRVFIKVRVMPS